MHGAMSRHEILDGLVNAFMAGNMEQYGAMCALARQYLRRKGIEDKHDRYVRVNAESVVKGGGIVGEHNPGLARDIPWETMRVNECRSFRPDVAFHVAKSQAARMSGKLSKKFVIMENQIVKGRWTVRRAS